MVAVVASVGVRATAPRVGSSPISYLITDDGRVAFTVSAGDFKPDTAAAISAGNNEESLVAFGSGAGASATTTFKLDTVAVISANAADSLGGCSDLAGRAISFSVNTGARVCASDSLGGGALIFLFHFDPD